MPPKSLPQLEIKSKVDDAWYEAKVSIVGKKLHVTFTGFDGDDEVLQGVQQVQERVRYQSKQLQDKECKNIQERTTVCALCNDDEFSKYFDARIVKVVRKEHKKKKRGEDCTCIFSISWLDGPCKDSLVEVKCEDICTICPEDVKDHPSLKPYLDILTGTKPTVTERKGVKRKSTSGSMGHQTKSPGSKAQETEGLEEGERERKKLLNDTTVLENIQNGDCLVKQSLKRPIALNEEAESGKSRDGDKRAKLESGGGKEGEPLPLGSGRPKGESKQVVNSRKTGDLSVDAGETGESGTGKTGEAREDDNLLGTPGFEDGDDGGDVANDHDDIIKEVKALLETDSQQPFRGTRGGRGSVRIRGRGGGRGEGGGGGRNIVTEGSGVSPDLETSPTVVAQGRGRGQRRPRGKIVNLTSVNDRVSSPPPAVVGVSSPGTSSDKGRGRARGRGSRGAVRVVDGRRKTLEKTLETGSMTNGVCSNAGKPAMDANKNPMGKNKAFSPPVPPTTGGGSDMPGVRRGPRVVVPVGTGVVHSGKMGEVPVNLTDSLAKQSKSTLLPGRGYVPPVAQVIIKTNKKVETTNEEDEEISIGGPEDIGKISIGEPEVNGNRGVGILDEADTAASGRIQENTNALRGPAAVNGEEMEALHKLDIKTGWINKLWRIRDKVVIVDNLDTGIGSDQLKSLCEEMIGGVEDVQVMSPHYQESSMWGLVICKEASQALEFVRLLDGPKMVVGASGRPWCVSLWSRLVMTGGFTSYKEPPALLPVSVPRILEGGGSQTIFSKAWADLHRQHIADHGRLASQYAVEVEQLRKRQKLGETAT